MKYLIPFLFLPSLALAQTGPAGSLTIGDHVHDGVTRAEFDALVTRVEVLEGVAPPGGDGGIPGGTGSLDCSNPDYVVCVDFEQATVADTGATIWVDAAGNDGATSADPHKPQIVSIPECPSGQCLQLTVDGDNGQNPTGSAGWDYPQQDLVYVAAKIVLLDGLAAKYGADSFDGAKSIKFIQNTPTQSTGSGDTVNVVDTSFRNAWSLTQRSDGKQYRVPLASGDFNVQPKSDSDFREYQNGACTYRHFTSGNPVYEKDVLPHPNPNNCVVIEDDTLYEVVLKLDRQSTPSDVALWVNGTLVSRGSSADGAGTPGPWSHIRAINYMTNYIAGSDPGLWRVLYDDIRVSQSCIGPSCPQS